MKNCLLLKKIKHPSSSEPSESRNLFTGGGSCLEVAGQWLVRWWMLKGWGGCGNFLKQDNDEV